MKKESYYPMWSLRSLLPKFFLSLVPAIILASAFILLLLLTGGCSSLPRQSDSSSPSFSNKQVHEKSGRPNWINDPYAYCSDSNEICAVGEGDGGMGAEARAYQAVAQIFETKIISKQSVNKVSEQNQDESGVVSGDVHEWASQDIQEITDQVLKGVVIKQRYEDGEKVYALASLDKREAAKDLQRQMELIDEQMKEIFKRQGQAGVTVSFSKLKRQYHLREALNLRYQFLAGKLFPQALSYEQIAATKKAEKDLPVIYFPENQNDHLEELRPLVNQLFNENDYKVVTQKEKVEYKYKVEGKLDSQEIPMNVEGFLKYDFHLILTLMNSLGEKVSSLEKKVTSVGRNLQQAKQKALEELRKFLIEKIADL